MAQSERSTTRGTTLPLGGTGPFQAILCRPSSDLKWHCRKAITVRLWTNATGLAKRLAHPASCAPRSRHCHVDGLFEDFHAIALAHQQRRIVAAQLLAIAELGAPFAGVENHADGQITSVPTSLSAPL